MATIVPTATTIRPYHRQGEIDYARLDYNPDEPVLKPDAMEQEHPLQHLLGLLASRYTDFGQRLDTFLSSNTILCYDPDDLNVRVSPDVYLAFGVDAQAIRQRLLYLPWEVGKPPDWVLEVASSSTAREDIGRKREIYARIGVPEYWRFDPSKESAYYKQPLTGERLLGGVYRPLPLTTEPDGILKAYSPVLGVSLCWDSRRPRLYDPATHTYMETWSEVAVAREAAETQVVVEQAAREAAETRVVVEQAARQVAESRATREQAARLAEQAAREAAESRATREQAARLAEQAAREAAEARIRQLEAELRRRRAEG